MTAWLAVHGYEGLYEVSDDGQIKSLARTAPMPRGGFRSLPETVLKPSMDRYGYLIVSLNRDGLKRTRTVHRLVAETFLKDSSFAGAQVRHLDGQHTNNTVDNIRWGTGSENIRDEVRHGRHVNARKTHCSQGHPFDEKNTLAYATKSGLLRRCRACANKPRNRRATKKVAA